MESFGTKIDANKASLGWKPSLALLFATVFIGPLLGGAIFGAALVGVVEVTTGRGIDGPEGMAGLVRFFSGMVVSGAIFGAVPGLIIGLVARRQRPDTVMEVVSLTTSVIIIPCALLLPFFGIGLLIFAAAVAAAAIVFKFGKLIGFSLR